VKMTAVPAGSGPESRADAMRYDLMVLSGVRLRCTNHYWANKGYVNATA
jgi:hypothetical protein